MKKIENEHESRVKEWYTIDVGKIYYTQQQQQQCKEKGQEN